MHRGDPSGADVFVNGIIRIVTSVIAYMCVDTYRYVAIKSVYLQTYSHTHEYVYVHVYVYMYMCTCVCLFLCVCVYVYVYEHVYVLCVCVGRYVCMYVRM